MPVLLARLVAVLVFGLLMLGVLNDGTVALRLVCWDAGAVPGL